MKTLENNTSFALENLTFAQLRSMSPRTPGGRVPTAKHLLETAPDILLQAMVTDTVLTVYTNGYFTARCAGRTTVYSVDRCSSIEYRFDDGTVTRLEEKDYCNGRWEVPLLLVADMRLEHGMSVLEENRSEFAIDVEDDERNTELSVPDALTIWLEEEEAKERDELHEKRMEALQAAMASLTDRQRQVVEMYFFRNMTQQQIGELLCIRQQTVMESLEGSIRKLKKFIEKNL